MVFSNTKLLIIFLFSAFYYQTLSAQTTQILAEVDHIVWVVKDLKSVKKGWANIGFSEIEDLKNVKLTSHGFKDDKGAVKATFAYLGGGKALWMQPLKGETIFSRYLAKNGEGAAALIHKVKDEGELNEVVQQFARANIGKIGTHTLQTKSGAMKYTIMDTREHGKYFLGFVIDLRSESANHAGKNELNLRFSQYAFAINNPAPVSDFWARAGLPAFEITHAEVWDRQYFGNPANFRMDLGWQRHGKIVYEWCIPLEGPNVYADHIRMHGEGIQHFGFSVDDIDAAIEYFRKRGYKISQSGGWGDKGKPGSGRFAYVDLSNIGGMTIELLWNYRE